MKNEFLMENSDVLGENAPYTCRNNSLALFKSIQCRVSKLSGCKDNGCLEGRFWFKRALEVCDRRCARRVCSTIVVLCLRRYCECNAYNCYRAIKQRGNTGDPRFVFKIICYRFNSETFAFYVPKMVLQNNELFYITLYWTPLDNGNCINRLSSLANYF